MREPRGCSSAGSSAIRIHRRKLTAQEACEGRVRPQRLRAGRGSPEPLEKPVPFFCPVTNESPVGPGGEPLRGLPPGPVEEMAARARGAPSGGSLDTIEPNGEQGEAAALERRLRAALGGDSFATLQGAEDAFVAVLGAPPAGRLGHLPTIRSLLWALARLDRYGSFGQGQPGAGLSVLEGKLEAQEHLVRWGEAVRPAHLGYFLPALRAEAKRWKHTWAPRIKAQRVAAGVRRAAAHQPVEQPVHARPAGGRRPSKYLDSTRGQGIGHRRPYS